MEIKLKGWAEDHSQQAKANLTKPGISKRFDQGLLSIWGITKRAAWEFNITEKNPEKMKNYLISVGVVTGILVVFVTLIQTNISHLLIWGIFLASPALLIWMVWSVLTAPVKVDETFDEQWYQDRPDLKRAPEES